MKNVFAHCPVYLQVTVMLVTYVSEVERGRHPPMRKECWSGAECAVRGTTAQPGQPMKYLAQPERTCMYSNSLTVDQGLLTPKPLSAVLGLNRVHMMLESHLKLSSFKPLSQKNCHKCCKAIFL